MKPKYSVIIPTHHRARLLDRALASIRAAQASDILEIIVIADSADEPTEAVCRKWLTNMDIYLKRNGPQGPARSRNLGINLCSGDYVLFLDDDDCWHENLLVDLENCVDLREGTPVYFDCSVVKESRAQDGPIFLSERDVSLEGILTEQIFVKNQIPICCMAFPRDTISNLSFDLHMRAYEDWDFVLSVLERTPLTHVRIRGAKIFEVDDETSDRRGSSADARNHQALMDYLYVYRRHPVNEDIQQRRAELLKSGGLSLPAWLL